MRRTPYPGPRACRSTRLARRRAVRPFGPFLAALLLAGAAAPAAAQPPNGQPPNAPPPNDGPRFASPPSLPSARGYSQVVAVPAGYRLLFVAGQVPLDSAGAVVGRGDFRAQARQVFENLRRALASEGATFADVVKLNYYVLDVAELSALREVRDQYVDRARPPASTLAEVRRLFRDDVMLEVEAVAAVRPR